MWQPNKISFTNLMTHKETEFVFKTNECIMIFGINATDSGADSNGGGKSTILEAITLAITGETNRGVSKEEFITDDEDECSIEFSLSNTVGDVNDLIIKRFFHRNKTAKIQIWENGVHNKTLTSPNQANKRIYELIGLSKEDLLHFFIIGQETSYSFLTANDIDKKNIISRFSNIEFIDEKIENLKSKRKVKESELVDLGRFVQKFENKIEFLQERKDELVSSFEQEKEEKVKSIKSKIKKIKNSKKDKAEEISKIEKKISKQEDLSSKILIEDSKKLKSEQKDLDSKISDIDKDIRECNHNISHLESIKDGSVICPSCSHEFSTDDDIDVSEIPEAISDLKKISDKLKKSRINLAEKRNLVSGKIEKNDDLRDEKEEIERNIKRLNSDLKIAENELNSVDKKIKSLRKEIEEIESKTIEEELSGIESEIKANKKSLADKKSEVDVINKDILELDFWIFHFGKKGFLTFLTNKSIKSIEGVTNSYLKQMNSDLQILMDGFTELKSGDVREKINISIVRNGYQIANFNRYSGGEKGRIKLANILGLQHLINLSANNGGLNFLGLDEVFEGLDRTGQIDVLNILENLKVTSVVITHRNQPIGATNELFVKKVKGVSKILNKNIQ